MEEFIKNIRDISQKDSVLAGGKGSSLGEMTRAGFPIPSGFVVLTDAFDQFLFEVDIYNKINTELSNCNRGAIHTIERASEHIQETMLKAEMPKNIEEEILSCFQELDIQYVAVRSSATSEDSHGAAWAGQLDSFLNTTQKTLLENVRKCWASLFTPRAIFYRIERGFEKSKISVAVIIQTMIQSEISGIAFSVHPVTEDPNQLIIEAGWGLGEAIVSGSITPDSYVVKKDSRMILDKNIVEQTRGIFCKEGGGNEWRDVSPEKRKKQILSDEQILELSDIVIRIENHYGFPCDIEWAFQDGKFYIIQSRPITTLHTNI